MTLAPLISLAATIATLALLSTKAQSQNATLSLSATRPSDPLCTAVEKCLTDLDASRECAILPIPESAMVPSVTPGTFLLTKLRDGVWAYDDGGYLSLILYSGTRLVLIDFPDSPGSNKPDGSKTRLTDAVEQLLAGATPRRIDMVYSHPHYDHIGAATRFYDYAKMQYPSARLFVWGTFATRTAIDASSTKRAVKPNVIVGERGRTLTVARGLRVRMKIVGGHTGSDLLLYIPKFGDQASVLMLVDVVFPRWSPFSNLALAKDVREYIEVHDDILKFKFDYFIGGHVRIGNRMDVVRNLLFTNDLVKAAGTALTTVTGQDFADAGIGRFSDPAAPEFGNVWFVFLDVVRKLQIDACYRIMLEKWGCKLAGMDRTLRTHCFTAVEYNLLDL